MDKYCVKWDDFEENIIEYPKMLRETQRLFDATFITEDGVHIQAHKIILTTASDFLRDIFIENNSSCVSVYLRGVTSGELERVLGFIYSGEAFIEQDRVAEFMETCKVLQLKDLFVEIIESYCENVSKSIVKRLCDQDDHYSKTDGGNKKNDKSVEADKSLNDVLFHPKIFEIKSENLREKADHDRELDLEIQEFIEKHDRQWQCKVCGKTAAIKKDIMNHAETHIKGMIHACQLCVKTFSNRPNLRNHVYNIHSELFDCESCGKFGMTRNAYRLHRRNQHF